MRGPTTKEALARSAPFAVLVDAELSALAERCPPPRQAPDGEWLFLEGEPAESLLIVVAGQVEVLRREGAEPGPGGERVWLLEAGAVIGEDCLLDRGPRLTSARSVGEVSFLELPLDLLRPLLPAEGSAEARVVHAIGTEIVRKLQASHQAALDRLRSELEERRLHAVTGRLHTRLVAAAAVYLLALHPASRGGPVFWRPEGAPWPLLGAWLLVFAAVLFGIIRSGPSTPRDHGLTLERWPAVLGGTLGWSTVAGALLAGIGLLLRRLSPETTGALTRELAHLFPPGSELLPLGLLLALLAPAQAFLANSVCQLVAERALPGRLRSIASIGLAALVTSVTCLPWSATVAALVFPLGLFWGWLWARQRSLLGVAVSRALLGNLALWALTLERLAPR
jgi:CRP-like cAMP-binding protein